MSTAHTSHEAPARQIIWVPKSDLSIHEAVLQTREDRRLIELIAEQLNAGDEIRDACEITPDNELLDGRHRWKAAMQCPRIRHIPCIVTDADPASVVCAKLTQRRHFSKSAKAYTLRHMAAQAAQDGRESRAGQARAAKASETRLIGLQRVKGLTLADMVVNSGLSEDILRQAMKLERDYMSRADKLVADWLELNPEEAESWQAWLDLHPHQEMPWTCWRAQRLAEMHVADDAKAVNVIRPNYREIEEDKIFNGIVDKEGDGDERRSYSLGASLKALGSIFATAGKPRPDLNPETPDIVTTLTNKVKTFSKTMWAQWDTIAPDQRQQVCKQLAEDVRDWPEDARAILIGHLKAAAAKSPAAAA